MATDHSKYPKQPYKPGRQPSESVTWVRNLDKHLNTPRVTVVLPPGSKNPIPLRKPKPKP